MNMFWFLTCRTKPGSIRGDDYSQYSGPSTIEYIEAQTQPCIIMSTSMLDFQNHDMELGRGGCSFDDVEDHHTTNLLDYYSEGTQDGDAESSASTLLQHEVDRAGAVAITKQMDNPVEIGNEVAAKADLVVIENKIRDFGNVETAVSADKKDVTFSLGGPSADVSKNDEPFYSSKWVAIGCIGFAIFMIPNEEFALILIGGYGLHGAAIGLLEEGKESSAGVGSAEKDLVEDKEEGNFYTKKNEEGKKERYDVFVGTEQQREQMIGQKILKDADVKIDQSESSTDFGAPLVDDASVKVLAVKDEGGNLPPAPRALPVAETDLEQKVDVSSETTLRTDKSHDGSPPSTDTAILF